MSNNRSVASLGLGEKILRPRHTEYRIIVITCDLRPVRFVTILSVKALTVKCVYFTFNFRVKRRHTPTGIDADALHRDAPSVSAPTLAARRRVVQRKLRRHPLTAHGNAQWVGDVGVSLLVGGRRLDQRDAFGRTLWLKV